MSLLQFYVMISGKSRNKSGSSLYQKIYPDGSSSDDVSTVVFISCCLFVVVVVVVVVCQHFLHSFF